MTIYQVTAWCSVPHYTTFEVEAANLRQALNKAIEQAANEYPEPCGGAIFEWDEFEVESANGACRRRRIEPSRLVEIAADDLLRAAQFTLPLLEVLACTRENDQERKAFYKMRRAINKATKQ
jgi:hypothetical protein